MHLNPSCEASLLLKSVYQIRMYVPIVNKKIIFREVLLTEIANYIKVEVFLLNQQMKEISSSPSVTAC
ncbi:hypothetical protein BME96_06105 [Virgibacillus halodenitrificans]|uniref:Uncharacterized protein n=1 Tax=Virgibacillus halodenitrificans TaxID=1482 RepID=A0AAC9NKK1_VIRHA|nr:hypothetical protein BME96_06105 [Virgibacillus halodenitrificans]